MSVQKENEIDSSNTDEIICPYCGYEFSDSWEFHDDSEIIECPECEKEFQMERNVSCDYTTYQIDPKKKELEEKRRKEAVRQYRLEQKSLKTI